MALAALLRRPFHGSTRLHLRKIAPFLPSELGLARSLSSSVPTDPPPSPSKPPSLSARLSFVFDQLDSLRRDPAPNDAALRRIQAWRSANPPPAPPGPPAQDGSGEAAMKEAESMSDVLRKEVELSHPWPEWIELMERLAHQNYFDLRRVDEDCVAAGVPIDLSEVKDEVAPDFSGDWITVRNACLNFGRDRFDILKSLSRKDLQILVGHGCPSTDPKVVFSAKLLRKLVHLDEGDVCSSCSLRNTCSRGYILTPKEDEARTLDVMHVLLTFGFDHIDGTVENKPLLKMKSVKTVVRKLIHEVVKLSSVPIDPNLPPPVVRKPPPKVKQPPPSPRKRVGRNDVEMKKGDWLCLKCDFMNFAKNTVCLQCDAKRPKRQLLPGEWECPRCNFLNYRRNMACFQCEHKRPPDEYSENQTDTKSFSPRTRMEAVNRVSDVSNAWNFDFDDNESDGADVAAFEFADSPKISGNSSLDSNSYRGIAREIDYDDDDDVGNAGRTRRNQQKGRNMPEANEKEPNLHSHRSGFHDFDDEDDDVDSYELDLSKGSQTSGVSRKNFSDLEMTSDSKEFGEFDNHTSFKRGSKDYAMGLDDEDLEDNPILRSTHLADFARKAGRRGGSARTRGLSIDSEGDDETVYDSDDFHGDIRSKQTKGHQESSDDEDLYFNSTGNDSRGQKLRGSNHELRSNRGMGKRSSADDGDDWSFRSSQRNDRSYRGGDYRQLRGNSRCDHFDIRDKGEQNRGRRQIKGGRLGDRSKGYRRNERGSNRDDREGYSNARHGRSDRFGGRFGALDCDERPRRRVIER